MKFHQIVGSQLSESKSSDYFSFIDFTFDQSVTITESYYPEINFGIMFSEFGGVLGFWLGVGVLQIGEHLSLAFARIRSVLTN